MISCVYTREDSVGNCYEEQNICYAHIVQMSNAVKMLFKDRNSLLFLSCSTVDEAENNLKNIKEEEGRSTGILIN